MCVQWCVPAGREPLDPVPLDPVLVDADELGDEEAELVCPVVVAELVAAVAAPPVEASATPAAPAPSPAAIAPVMTSRRIRLPAVETIWVPSLHGQPRVAAGLSVSRKPARSAWHRPETALSAHSELEASV